jgi:hypothetical protein
LRLTISATLTAAELLRDVDDEHERQEQHAEGQQHPPARIRFVHLEPLSSSSVERGVYPLAYRIPRESRTGVYVQRRSG